VTDDPTKKKRRTPFEQVCDGLPSLNADQMFEACRHLVSTSPRQAVILATVLQEARDEVTPKTTDPEPRTAGGSLE